MVVRTRISTAADRDVLALAIARHRASHHGREWGRLPARVCADYMTDSVALIERGLTPIVEDHDPGPTPAISVEVEAVEFDQAMQWWVQYVYARHGGTGSPGADWVPSGDMEQMDAEDWDAYMSIAVTVSEGARLLYEQRFAQMHGLSTPAPGPVAPTRAAASAPPAADVRRHRIATAIAAVLAYRHGHGWMQCPSDVRAAYLSDAYSLIEAGLTCY